MNTISRNNKTSKLNFKLMAAYFMESGESVRVEVNDFFGNFDYDQNYEKPNKELFVTGPIFLNDVCINDTFKITIQKIENNNKGITSSGEVVDVKDVSKLSLGFIGVPNKKQNVVSTEIGSHGGNLEFIEIKENATIYLPIYSDGGYLFVGNLFTHQENKKIYLSGTVQLKVQAVKNFKIKAPIVVNQDKIHFLYTNKSEERAKIELEKIITKHLTTFEDLKKEYVLKLIQDKIELVNDIESNKLYKLTLDYNLFTHKYL